MNLKSWLTAVCILLTFVIGGVSLIDDDEDGKPDRVQVTVPIPKAPVGDLAAPAEDNGDDPADSVLRDETPASMPAPTLDQAAAQADDVELEPKEVGGAQNYEVRQDFSGAVYSSRNGAPVLNFIVHCTVSPNLDGWGDIYAVRDYFKRTRIASATFIGDFEGHILQMVPRDQKPWTTGFFNPWSKTIEIISTCTESREQWINSKLIEDGILSSLMRDEMRRSGIPIRRVDPLGCNVPTGYFDHAHAECGNFHTDISFGCRTLLGEPTYMACNFPWELLAKQLADGVCGERCQEHRHVRRIIKRRVEAHADTHAVYQREDCRGRMHEVPLRKLQREACRAAKAKGHEEHKAIRRARKRLHDLQGG